MQADRGASQTAPKPPARVTDRLGSFDRASATSSRAFHLHRGDLERVPRDPSSRSTIALPRSTELSHDPPRRPPTLSACAPHSSHSRARRRARTDRGSPRVASDRPPSPSWPAQDRRQRRPTELLPNPTPKDPSTRASEPGTQRARSTAVRSGRAWSATRDARSGRGPGVRSRGRLTLASAGQSRRDLRSAENTVARPGRYRGAGRGREWLWPERLCESGCCCAVDPCWAARARLVRGDRGWLRGCGR